MKSVFHLLFLISVITVCSYVDADGPDYRCQLPLEKEKKHGNRQCMAYHPRYGYDSTAGECVKFIYGGCGGNENNFYNKALCEKACKYEMQVFMTGRDSDYNY